MVVETKKIKVAVGLSGGVDSSVAALLLKKAGFDVTGVYLKCYWTFVGCQSDKDRSSAAKTAAFLNIPFEVWDFEKEYREKVVDYFYREYKNGRTPNPDVVCNKEIKFGLFYKEAVENRGFDFIATGHYAGVGLVSTLADNGDNDAITFPFLYQKKINSDNLNLNIVATAEYFNLICKKNEESNGNSKPYYVPEILGGVDKEKDQSYFLYDIEKKSLEHSLYPLFLLTKSEVRAVARQENLPSAGRPDSQGICFIGEVNIENFLKKRIFEHVGDVTDIAGNIIGYHKGIEFYTIGQRHGFVTNSRIKFKQSKLPVGKGRSSNTLPYYVIDKDMKTNRLIVGVGEECKKDKFHISNIRWRELAYIDGQSLFVRIRHLGELTPCTIKTIGGGAEVYLNWPVFGVAPGQSAVFYRELATKDKMLPKVLKVIGGGIIL